MLSFMLILKEWKFFYFNLSKWNGLNFGSDISCDVYLCVPWVWRSAQVLILICWRRSERIHLISGRLGAMWHFSEITVWVPRYLKYMSFTTAHLIFKISFKIKHLGFQLKIESGHLMRVVNSGLYEVYNVSSYRQVVQISKNKLKKLNAKPDY